MYFLRVSMNGYRILSEVDWLARNYAVPLLGNMMGSRDSGVILIFFALKVINRTNLLKVVYY